MSDANTTLDATSMRRITAYVVGGAALSTGLAFLVGGPTVGLGAAVGGVYAIVNWVLMRWLGRRLLVASDRGRLFLGLILGAKVLVAMAVVWAILSTGIVDPIGFVMGLSALVAGVLGGTFHGAVFGGPRVSREEA